MPAISVLGPVWVVLGLLIIGCALVGQRRERALAVGYAAVASLWVAAGAGFNATALLAGEDYSGFADAADLQFVTDSWESLVVPHHEVFIWLLVAFQTVCGLLVLVPGRLRETALVALIAFNLALVSFGWAFVFWALPMALALLRFLRVERRRRGHGPTVGERSGNHPSPTTTRPLTPERARGGSA